MDSIFIKKYRQDLQDFLDFYVPYFPEENEETSSDFVGNLHFIWQPVLLRRA